MGFPFAAQAARELLSRRGWVWVITPFSLEASESYRWNILSPPPLSLCISLSFGCVLFFFCWFALLAGYTLRLFCIAFTTKMPGQMKKTCYAQAGQVRVIRKKMVDLMTEEASSEDLKGLINKL